jgi:hypothetical protein
VGEDPDERLPDARGRKIHSELESEASVGLAHVLAKQEERASGVE